MNLTCTTSYCNPPANITWYMSSTDITSQSTNTTDVSNNLVKTTSQLLSQVVKTDNGKQVYCTASNILGRSVQSMMHTVIVWCRYWYTLIVLYVYLMFFNRWKSICTHNPIFYETPRYTIVKNGTLGWIENRFAWKIIMNSSYHCKSVNCFFYTTKHFYNYNGLLDLKS